MMSREYIKPRFKSIKPYSILKSISEIEKSKYYNPDFVLDKEPSEDKFKVAYRKFENNEELTTKEYKILAYYLEVINKHGNLNIYFNSFNINFNRFVGYRGFVRPLLSFIYNYELRSIACKTTYEAVKKVINKLKDKEKFKNVYITVKSNSKLDGYTNNIRQQFKKANTLEEIELLLKKYFIRNTDKFYFYCMVEYIAINHKNEELFDKYRDTVNNMPLELQQEVFKGILEHYVDNYDVDSYPDRWFALIGKILKEPYSTSNTRWDNISDKCKEAYRRWNNNKYLYDFFSNTVEGGDQERLDFWKKYIDSIYRIMYFKNTNDALIMQFKDHVFAEFAQRNNALYVYDKRVYSIDHLEKIANRRSIIMDDLKDKNLAMKRMNHRPGWQFIFEKDIKRLGYEPGRW